MLKSPLGDTYFYDFFEGLEMEIELDKIAFTCRSKGGTLCRFIFPQVSELIYQPVIKEFFHATHELALCCCIKRIIY